MTQPLEELEILNAKLNEARQVLIVLREATEGEYDDIREPVDALSAIFESLPSVSKVIDALDALNISSDDPITVESPDSPEETNPIAAGLHTEASGSSGDPSTPVVQGELVPVPKNKDWEVAKRKRGEALTNAELALMLRVREDGLTQAQIAQRLNCSQMTVSRLLKEWHDNTSLATAHLKRKSMQMAETLIERANPEEILEIFDRTGVAEKKRKETDGGGTTVMIGLKIGKQE